MITIPSLSDVTDILDTDLVMVTNAQGQSYKIAGSELNKSNKIIIADSTTVTGTPLKTGNCVRIYFTANINGVNASTTMQINYNGTNYYVKVPKNGALANYVAFDLGSSIYRYVQAYTTLELLFDGTQFVIIGNPVVISSTDNTIYADGLERVNIVEESNKNMVTSGAIVEALYPYRNVRVGEIYSSNDYYKIKVKGNYGRPIVFTIISAQGAYEKIMFGQTVVSKKITLGNSLNAGLKYIAPTSNAADGYLFIKSSTADLSLNIYYTSLLTKFTAIMTASTAEEYATGNDF
jgi:hypothetical protein